MWQIIMEGYIAVISGDWSDYTSLLQDPHCWNWHRIYNWLSISLNINICITIRADWDMKLHCSSELTSLYQNPRPVPDWLRLTDGLTLLHSPAWPDLPHRLTFNFTPQPSGLASHHLSLLGGFFLTVKISNSLLLIFIYSTHKIFQYFAGSFR